MRRSRQTSSGPSPSRLERLAGPADGGRSLSSRAALSGPSPPTRGRTLHGTPAAADSAPALNPFTAITGDPASPWILHVPHSSTRIPGAIRERILLDDEALAAELTAMTDAHIDLLARRITERVDGPRPWSFVNRLSRLVVDPERFPDEREAMNNVGMGAVYTRTSSGARLRDDSPAHTAELIATLFDPYSHALADLVDDRLAATGRATIFDLHSYPTNPLPYELFADDERPAVCLGADDLHTPTQLLDAARVAFETIGSVAVNQPFRGTYVPLRHYGRDDRVASIMLELRRDAYLHEDGAPDNAAIDRFATAAASVIDDASDEIERGTGSAQMHADWLVRRAEHEQESER